MTENNKKKIEDCRHQWAPLMAKAGKKTLPSLVNVCLKCGELKVGQRTIRMSRYRLDMGGLPIKNTSTRWGASNLEWGTDKLLKGAGAGADPVEIETPSADFFDKFREFIPWVSLDGFTIGGDTGYSVAANGAYLLLYAAATVDYDAYCCSKGLWVKLLDSGKVITFDFPLLYLNSITALNIWVRMAAGTADPPSETVGHFGWKIINADLYASNADGTTQTITDTTVDLVAATQRTRLKIVFTPGTNCKFYVNDVLKVTHTTNLPTAANYYFHVHVRTTVAEAKHLQIGRILLEKEH